MLHTRRQYSYMTRKKKWKNGFFGFAVFFLLCALFFLVHRLIIGMYRTGSAAMNPALESGDCVIATPFYFLNPDSSSGDEKSRRGDIVVMNPRYATDLGFPLNVADEVVSFVTFQRFSPFRSDYAWGDKPVIRRLLGLPGDTLYMKNFVLYIRPAGTEHFLTEFELVPREKNYNILSSPLPIGWSDNLPFSGSFGALTLGDDEFFVLSDNRVAVNDSRVWGAVNANDVGGKVVFRYWPLPKAGKL